jgi:hypothetical protein
VSVEKENEEVTVAIGKERVVAGVRNFPAWNEILGEE